MQQDGEGTGWWLFQGGPVCIDFTSIRCEGVVEKAAREGGVRQQRGPMRRQTDGWDYQSDEEHKEEEGTGPCRMLEGWLCAAALCDREKAMSACQ